MSKLRTDGPPALPWEEGAARIPAWLHFDEAWYRLQCPDVERDLRAGVGANAVEHYRLIGQVRSYSPNRWFDENWYLDRYPDVDQAVREGVCSSGFHHYVRFGHKDRAPNWLFSEKHYRSSDFNLTDSVLRAEGLANGYDHYLSGGEAGFRSGSLFFDPAVFCQFQENRSPSPDEFIFGRFLHNENGTSDICRGSWYFDPVWYLDRYPAVRDLIAGGTFSSALHHYLTVGEAGGHSPQAAFSEEFYRDRYPDVAAGIGAGLFRSGYDHFLSAGAFEGRQPAGDIGLVDYAARPAVRADVESGIFRDPFAHWVASHEQGNTGYTGELLHESHSKMMFCREAAGRLVDVGRGTLDFSHRGRPDVSVIMVLHNQFPLTMMALASLRDCYPGGIDLIVIDSGSRDETKRLENYVSGARIRHLDHNAGFLLSCNMALEMAEADAVLYLNNDVKLAPGAVRIALDRLYSDERIGAVGGKIIRTNGLLQEAGSIIWRDGSAYGYLRERDPNCPEANFVRDVDYCSGAFLLTRTGLARALEGFDTAYAPAYFEESDFCVRVNRAGYRVVYDPCVVIEHLEFGSSSASSSNALMQRNRRIFVARQAEFLRGQYPAHVGNAILARSRPSRGPRVLFIEDRIPLRSLGSGYVRSNDVVGSLARQGCAVTVFPADAHYHSLGRIYGDFPDTVEVLFDRSAEDMDRFLEERAGSFDLIWIGRTHNLARMLPVLHKNSRYLPGAAYVLDTEAVVSPRQAMRNAVLASEAPESEPAGLDEALRAEFDSASFCQQVVAVTEAEAELVRRAGHHNVSVLGHMLSPRPTPRSFAERSEILFVGAIIDAHSPNLDSLLWFGREVMPLIRRKLGAEMRLTCVGSHSGKVDLSELRACPGINVVGEVEDLRPFYDAARVFVAPTRFAAGIPYKIHESAAYGVPVVASDLLIRQLGWTPDRDIMAGGAPTADIFAEAVTRLYFNESLWNDIRDAGLRRIETDCNPERFDAAVKAVLEGARGDALRNTLN